jgi:subtilisin-like proprotein convertase family protein
LRERTPWFVNGATWVNGGGFHVSANYGFGLVDARAAVRLAETWDAQQTSANEQRRTAQFTGPLVLNTANTSRELLLEIAPGMRAEQVTLALDIGGMLAQELEIELISPRGTASMLFFHSGGAAPGGQPQPFRPWTFVSNAFLGEDAGGTWRLVLRDTIANNSTGTINSAVLSVFGAAAGPDDRYVFTDEFGAVAGMAHGAVLADAERELAELAQAIRSAKREDEAGLLDRLTRLAGQVEGQYAATHSRFSASRAYFELIDRRIHDIRESRLSGLQTIAEFMERRLSPARSTCDWAVRRQTALSERVSRMSNLLRTRVEIEQQQSNQELLATMNRRQGLQLQLQSTVEGLSVAAITYYITGLVHYVVEGLSRHGWPWGVDITTAATVPLVALLVWLFIRRIHDRITAE